MAFHHADLTLEEREIVEDGFRSGEVRAIVATTTLAIGMNLPAKNVLLDGRRWKMLRQYGRWSLEDLAKSEYENMSGRAGRLSLTEDENPTPGEPRHLAGRLRPQLLGDRRESERLDLQLAAGASDEPLAGVRLGLVRGIREHDIHRAVR